jgi:hypothetical protein
MWRRIQCNSSRGAISDRHDAPFRILLCSGFAREGRGDQASCGDTIRLTSRCSSEESVSDSSPSRELAFSHPLQDIH